MKENRVKFSIQPGGGIAFEVMNGQGEDCTKVTEDLELHLSQVGNKVDEGKKPEYYEGGGGVSVFNDLN